MRFPLFADRFLLTLNRYDLGRIHLPSQEGTFLRKKVRS
jgi:hypothetical protein